MTRLIVAFLLVLAGLGPAMAQTRAWVQIEAKDTLREAQQTARDYARTFPDVNGFRMTSGWYAIALGPFTPEGALTRLARLRREGRVPVDSYVTDGQLYVSQFWPVGTGAEDPPAAGTAPDAATAEDTPGAAPQPPAPPEETPSQARRSEAQLTRAQKMALQEALQWEGFYDGAIDAAFGRGTRGAMAAWQEAQGLEPTGILTTRQRAALLQGYRDALASLGMTRIEEETAGIAIDIPGAMVAFARYAPPFVQYDSTGDSGVRVLLISQSGDRDTLFGLYDIMQTLEIVPPEGDRERRRDSFVLTGEDEELRSFTYAALESGAVKGFTLVWEPGRDKLMRRAVQMMRDSFTPRPGVVLPDSAGDPAAYQGPDLVSGLDVRRPALSRSGFYVDDSGAVLTTDAVLDQCDRLTLGRAEHPARLVARDAALGLALMRPETPLAPIAHAAFQAGVPRLNADIAVAGYSYGGVLEAPVLTFGTLADLRGLNGEEEVARLDLSALPGDAGGPVLDSTGAVTGVLLAQPSDGRQLPEDVRFAAQVPALAGFLSSNGVTMTASVADTPLAAEDLTRAAADMTVLVSCWK